MLKIISRSFNLFLFPSTQYMYSTKSVWVKRGLKAILDFPLVKDDSYMLEIITSKLCLRRLHCL